MNKSKTKLAGWILSGLLSAFLIFASASGKFTDWEGKEEMFSHLGWSIDTMVAIGILEVLIAILYLVPRIAFYGAIMLSAYLGGAVATHVRVGDPYFMPALLGIVAWVSLALRDPSVWNLALGKRNELSTTD
ncbi:DoxX family protein [Pelagicoccus sp. SDUM812003]|uniref:DoxX family protein n=1 Tax=Pelagicoccus sp. SDUM812003 TaxID=3041267 RepID=UPI0028107A72|nr:DoxX family protein [Pelagicoccus sp. SDUM812003]MDQ8201397.1 DoxX family protein [Pelagicoccus sp. SDUM812003]